MKGQFRGSTVTSTSVIALMLPLLPTGAQAASEQELLRRIEELEARLERQATALEDYRAQFEDYREVTAAHIGELTGLRAGQAGSDGAEGSGDAPTEPVGEAPAEDREDIGGVTALYEVGGVLTPKGHVALEPSIEYSHASANRFTFRGVELQEVLLIGVVEAEDADRDFLSANVTGRVGVTDRLELEARIPYVYRDDNLTFNIPALGEEELERRRSLSNDGLGDIEVAGHYQLNAGRNGWPVFVGNARFKTRTGEGPFDIERDAFGVEEEVPTGSGFYEVEPSLTAIMPTDPAVLFANLGYGWRIKDSDIDEPVGDFIVQKVDPGDAVRASVGMGFAVNDDFSFTLGYKHTFLWGNEITIFNSETLETTTEETASLHLGSGLFGMSYKLSDSARVNLDLELGITEDAPDMRATLRVPVDLGKVF